MSPLPPNADAHDHTKRPVVLIVDDSEKNLKLARDVLRTAGFRTLEAASGAEAVALATANLPDVILMDLELPDMDGIEVLRKLAETPPTTEIPVVALSAHRLEGDERLLAAGFAGYLAKPMSVSDFPDQVRGFLRSAQTPGRPCP